MDKKKKSSKKNRKTESFFEKTKKYLSDAFEEDEEEKDNSKDDDELEIDIEIDFDSIKKRIGKLTGFSGKNRHVVRKYIIHSLVIVSVLILIYLLTMTDREVAPVIPPDYVNGTYFDEQGNQVYNTTPIIIFNPTTNDARLVIRENVFVRVKREYGIYADLIYYSSDKGITREEMDNAIDYKRNKLTVYVGDEVHYKGAFEAIAHIPISFNKKEDILYSDKFKLYPLKNAGFILLWGNKQEFPYGTVSDTRLVKYNKV